MRLDKVGKSLGEMPFVVPRWMIDAGIKEGIVKEVEGRYFHYIYGELVVAKRLDGDIK